MPIMKIEDEGKIRNLSDSEVLKKYPVLKNLSIEDIRSYGPTGWSARYEDGDKVFILVPPSREERYLITYEGADPVKDRRFLPLFDSLHRIVDVKPERISLPFVYTALDTWTGESEKRMISPAKGRLSGRLIKQPE